MSAGQAFVEVLSPGAHTAVQDTGRPGYLGRGIPPSGAQDNFSLRFANRCVGNPFGQPLLTQGSPGAAGLELTLRGPKLRFSHDSVIAVTGADFPVAVNGEPVPTWQAVPVPADGVVEIGAARSGIRGYLAVAGGFDVPLWLGSHSTYVRGGQGGFKGRGLRRGDKLPIGEPEGPVPAANRVPEEVRPRFDEEPVLRVVLGPQDDLIEEESVAEFFSARWQLSPTSDRMGFRVNGVEMIFKPRRPELVREAGALPSNVVLDVTPIGGIQITSGTEAIIMGVEAPSIGGYAKIATVISSDLDVLGQVRPAQFIRFRAIDLEEALEIGRERSRIVEETKLETVD